MRKQLRRPTIMYNQWTVPLLETRGSSSINGTKDLCNQLPTLFSQYNIKSIFDAGACDAAWQTQTLDHMVDYHAGERNASIVNIAKQKNPSLSIQVHDMTKDIFPNVDLLFVRDVTIHMNNYYKRKLLDNWISSSIPWILTTQINDCQHNIDFELVPGEWKFAEINWLLTPWNFPNPVNYVTDGFSQRFMSLWHKDQLTELVCQWPE